MRKKTWVTYLLGFYLVVLISGCNSGKNIPQGVASPLPLKEPSRVPPNASKVTPNASKVTPNASKVTPGASKVTPGASTVTPGASTVTPGASTVTPGASTPLSRDSSCSSSFSSEDSSIVHSEVDNTQWLNHINLGLDEEDFPISSKKSPPLLNRNDPKSIAKYGNSLPNQCTRRMGRPQTKKPDQTNLSVIIDTNVNKCFQVYRTEWEKINKRLNAIDRNSQKSSCLDNLNVEITALKKHIEDMKENIDLTSLTKLSRLYQELQEKLSFCRIKDLTDYFSNNSSKNPFNDNYSKNKNNHSFSLRTTNQNKSEPNHEDKMLLHVLGAAFGEGSGLEGQTSDQSIVLLKRRIMILKALSEQLKHNQYIVSIDQANPCRNIEGVYHPSEEDRPAPLADMDTNKLDSIIEHSESAVELTKSFINSQKEFHENFLKSVKSLNKKDWFYFMGGSSNHSVIYQVMKTGSSEDSYQFRVYNSGDGANFHESILDGSHRRLYPFVEIRDLTEKKITGLSFLKALRDLQIQYPEDEGDINSKTSFLYDNVLSELRGTRTTYDMKSEGFLEPQIAGNCSYYVFPYRDNSDLGDQVLGANLEFFVKSVILDQYFKVNQDRLMNPDFSHNPARKLAEKSLTFYQEELARNISVDPSWKDTYLDRGMVQESDLRVAQYRKILDDAYNKLKEVRDEQVYGYNQNANVQIQVTHKESSKNDFVSTKGYNAYLINEYSENSIELSESLDVERWNPEESNQLNENINQFWQKLIPQRFKEKPIIYTDGDEKNSQDRIRELARILTVIPEIIRKIPIKKDLLKTLLPEYLDLETFLGHLNDLSQLHYWALFNSRLQDPSNRLRLSSVSVLTQIKILTLADQVIKIYGESEQGIKFKEFPSLYNSILSWLILGKKSKPSNDPMMKSNEEISFEHHWLSYLSIEGLWINPFNEMLDYWKEEDRLKRIENPIFQWDRYPLYVSAKKQNEKFYRAIFKDNKDPNLKHWSASFGLKENEAFWNDIKWIRSNFSDLNDMKKALNSLCYNNHANVLPRVFFEIRDITFLTHYILSSSYSSEILKKFDLNDQMTLSYFKEYHSKRISKPINFSVEEPRRPFFSNTPKDKEYYENNYDIFKINEKVNYNYNNYFSVSNTQEMVNMYDGDKDYMTGDPVLSLKIHGDRSCLDPWSSILESRHKYHVHDVPVYSHLSSRQIISHIPLRKSGDLGQVSVETLEMERKLCNLGHPLVTLAYFIENSRDLQTKKWQILFKALIFQPNLLFEEFKNTLQLRSMLSNFTWNNFEERLSQKDYLTASFFARMHQLLEEFTDQAGRKEDFPKNRHARDAFQKILKNLEKISDVKNIVFRDLIRTFRFEDFENLDSEKLALFVEAVIYRNLNALEDSIYFEAEEEDAVYGIYQFKLNSLEKRVDSMEEDERNQFMNRIVRNFGYPNSSFTWKKEEKIWLGTDVSGSISLDLSRPKILTGKAEKKRLPGIIADNARFKEFVSSNVDQTYVNWLGRDRYEIVDQEHRIRIDGTPGVGNHAAFKIQKKWGDRWYELIDDAVINERAVAFSNSKERERKTENDDWQVIPGYQNWISVTSYNNDNTPDSPHAYEREGAIKDWDSSSNPVEVLAFDPKDKHLYAVSRKFGSLHASYGQKVIVQKVKYDRGQAKIDGTTLFRLNENDSLSFLYRIEDPRFVWVWRNSNNTVQKVELPRFGVSFEPKNRSLVSPELEGYALSRSQRLPTGSEQWGDFPHFIVLEKENKFRIAIPEMTFKARFLEESLRVHYDLDWFSRILEEQSEGLKEISRYGRGSQKLLVWPTDSSHFSDLEDRFYLTFIHLWGHSEEYDSYGRARELLYASRSDQGEFTNSSRKILEWIFSMENNDHDPRALALRLGAALLIIENDLSHHRYWHNPKEFQGKKVNEPRHSKFIKLESKKLDVLYDSYLKVRDKIASNFFPEDLERLFLKNREILPYGEGNKYFNKYLHQARLAEIEGKDPGSVRKIKATEPANFKKTMDNEINAYSYSEAVKKYNENKCRKVNLYQGLNANFKFLYDISLEIDELTNNSNTSARSGLVSLLTGIFNVERSVLDQLNNEELKEEYLSLLRLYLRQQSIENRKEDSSALNENCHSMVKFLYSLATSTDDVNRSEIKISTSDWSKFETDARDFGNLETYMKRCELNEKFKNFFKAVDWSFLEGSVSSEVLVDTQDDVDTQDGSAHRARYWDPRTESIPSNFKYRYDRNKFLNESSNDSQYDLQEKPVISVDNLNQYFQKRSLTEAEKQEIVKTSRTLAEVFSKKPIQSTRSRCDENYDSFIRKKLEDYQKLILKKKEDLEESVYTLREGATEGLKKYRDNQLKDQLIEVQGFRDNFEKAILEDLRSFPDTAWEQVRERLFRNSAIQARSSLKEVLQAYAMGSFEQIFVMNPGLNQERGLNLLKNTTSYLITATYALRVQEVMRAIDQFIKIENPTQEEMQQFYKTATALRSYKIEDHPDYLAFEYWMKILIRPDQIKNLSQLTGEKTALLEMIMGSGKTSVLLPLASHANAIKEKQLSMVVLPETLVTSMSKDLSYQLELIYGQGIDRITIHRNHEYDLKKIQYLYSRIRKDLDTGRVIVTSNTVSYTHLTLPTNREV